MVTGNIKVEILASLIQNNRKVPFTTCKISIGATALVTRARHNDAHVIPVLAVVVRIGRADTWHVKSVGAAEPLFLVIPTVKPSTGVLVDRLDPRAGERRRIFGRALIE